MQIKNTDAYLHLLASNCSLTQVGMHSKLNQVAYISRMTITIMCFEQNISKIDNPSHHVGANGGAERVDGTLTLRSAELGGAEGADGTLTLRSAELGDAEGADGTVTLRSAELGGAEGADGTLTLRSAELGGAEGADGTLTLRSAKLGDAEGADGTVTLRSAELRGAEGVDGTLMSRIAELGGAEGADGTLTLRSAEPFVPFVFSRPSSSSPSMWMLKPGCDTQSPLLTSPEMLPGSRRLRGLNHIVIEKCRTFRPANHVWMNGTCNEQPVHRTVNAVEGDERAWATTMLLLLLYHKTCFENPCSNKSITTRQAESVSFRAAVGSYVNYYTR